MSVSSAVGKGIKALLLTLTTSPSMGHQLKPDRGNSKTEDDDADNQWMEWHCTLSWFVTMFNDSTASVSYITSWHPALELYIQATACTITASQTCDRVSLTAMLALKGTLSTTRT